MVCVVCIQKADIWGLGEETVASADHFNHRLHLPVIILLHAAVKLPTNGKPDFCVLDGKHKTAKQAYQCWI